MADTPANALAGADDSPSGSTPPPPFLPEAAGRVPLHVIAIIVVSIALLVGLMVLILFPELTLFLPRRAGLVR